MANKGALHSADAGGLETVARNTLQEQIYLQLRNSIMSGFFKPGQPLSTRVVAEAVGVSVMPVRDALRRLEVENALVVGYNRTLEVPRLDIEAPGGGANMRVALECLAITAAAERNEPGDMNLLSGLCRTMEESVHRMDIDAYLQANWAFHRHIYRCNTGAILMSAIESLWLRMGPYFRLVANDHQHLDHAMTVHRGILEALRDGDAEAARRGVKDDIDAATRDLAAWLAQSAQQDEEQE